MALLKSASAPSRSPLTRFASPRVLMLSAVSGWWAEGSIGWRLDAFNPLPIFPNGLNRSQVARVKNIFGGAGQVAAFQIVPGIARADGDKLQHAGIAVAI